MMMMNINNGGEMRNTAVEHTADDMMPLNTNGQDEYPMTPNSLKFMPTPNSMPLNPAKASMLDAANAGSTETALTQMRTPSQYNGYSSIVGGGAKR